MKYFEKTSLDYNKALKSTNIFSKGKRTRSLLDKPNKIKKLLEDKGPLYKKENIFSDKGPLYEKQSIL